MVLKLTEFNGQNLLTLCKIKPPMIFCALSAHQTYFKIT